jgi:peroxiredoxin
LRQLSDYGERYRDFKQAGIEVLAVSPESPRRSRRLRTGLKLPFTVLSDWKLEAARNFGLIGHEKPGQPTPATLVLDRELGVRSSTLNEGAKCLFARDTLEYARALKQGSAPHSIPRPRLELPKPGSLFARSLVNLAAGLVIR